MGYFVYECSDDVQEKISPLLRSQGIEVTDCPLSKADSPHPDFQFSCSREESKILINGFYIQEEQTWLCELLPSHSLLYFRRVREDVQLIEDAEAILKESGVFKSPRKVEEK